MLNKISLIGRLGEDPKVRRLDNGNVVANFSLATSESYKDKSGEWQNKTEWHNIVVWGKAAESAERNLNKGKLAYIEGKSTTRKWTDKNGNDRYTTEVVAYTIRLLEKKDQSSSSSSYQDAGELQMAQSGPDDLPF